MATNIFILGAGASAEAGAPLMRGFLDRAVDLNRGVISSPMKEFYDIVQEGRAALQATHSKSDGIDIYNMESVFSAFEMSKMLGGFAGVSLSDVNRFSEAYRKVIAATLEESIRFPASGENGRRTEPPKPYERFVQLLDKMPELTGGQATILTFNYDLCLDYALFYCRKKFTYSLSKDNFEGIKVLKLHGSLNWTNCTVCGSVHALEIEQATATYNWDYYSAEKDRRLRLSRHLSQATHCNTQNATSSPFLVPPTWNKSQYHQDIVSVWKVAAKELAQAENIFVIGYSLPETDIFFHYLYSLGVASSTFLRRFWVIDPNKEVSDRFQKLLGARVRSQYRFFEETFSSGIESIKTNLKKGVY